MIHYYREEEEQVIRSILHNLYQECKGFGKKSSISKEQETAFLLEEFMKRRYEFRYNTVQDDLEYRQRDSVHFCFKPVDKRVRNSIAINALKEGISAWDRDVDRFLNSECVPLYNPVEEYLYETGRWDGKDRIRALAGLLPCDNPHWQELFTAGFLVWWRIGGELIGSMVIILRLYWSVRRGIASLHFVALFCRRSCVSVIRTVLISKVNRRRNAIWDVFSDQY